MENNALQPASETVKGKIKEDLLKTFDSKRKRIFSKTVGAALGSIPWVGGFLSALADFKADEGQVQSNTIFLQWLEEHNNKIKQLVETLEQTMSRLNEFPEEIDECLESEAYIQLVRKSLRSWDQADTKEKQDYIRKLLTNAGAYQLVPDDLIRLFLDWINLYHEAHFAVIRALYQMSGSTRYDIWQNLNGNEVREYSLEADLFKLLIRDLSTGSVMRQHGQTDYYGNFLKKSPQKTGQTTRTLKSAFDNQEGYELTELGQQFVHYTMNEVVPRIA
jgi:regulator of replication initiation timing